MNRRQDSVQGYLESKKLLTSKSKSRERSNTHTSLVQSLMSKHYSHNESTTMREQKQQKQAIKISLLGNKNQNQSSESLMVKNPLSYEKKYSTNKKTSRYKLVGPIGKSSRQSSTQIKREQHKIDYITPSKFSTGSQFQFQQLINKIVYLKSCLEVEVHQLQYLLDSTSKYLQNIDFQYQKVKEKVLAFTSAYLDSAFKEYKENFPDWTIFQNVEHEGLNKLQQINYILDRSRSGLIDEEFALSFDLQKKIQGYSSLIRNVQKTRRQCAELKPTVLEEKIKKFQAAVIYIGKF